MIEGLNTEDSSIRDFVEEFVASKSTTEQATGQTNKEDPESDWRSSVRPISAPTILVCSHHSRDSRCGVLGPLLHSEFSQYINKRQTLRNQAVSDIADKRRPNSEAHSYASHPAFQPDTIDRARNNEYPVNVGMISHIGGHKWAGNVIVYIPPDYHLRTLERENRGKSPKDKVVAGESHSPEIPEDQPMLQEEQEHGLSPLAGKGIWYGRVEPKHVEGIVEQTIGHGQVIRELFRGGINQDGSAIRL